MSTVMLRQSIKSVCRQVAPDLTMTLLSVRSRRLQERWARETGLTALAETIAEAAGFECHGGPFRGMRFPPDVVTRHSSPKLLGTYEQELHPWLETAFSRSYDVVVNIGMAEGYYTVGCALRLPDAQVYGFDADPAARTRTRELAKHNAVADRVHVRGLAKHGELQRLCDGRRSLLLIDCEGCEAAILDPDAWPGLRHTDIIAELHPNVVPDIEQMIFQKFAGSHDLQLERSRPRAPQDLPELSGVSRPDIAAGADEQRGLSGQPWIVLWAKKYGP